MAENFGHIHIDDPISGICDRCIHAELGKRGTKGVRVATYDERLGRVITCYPRYCGKLMKPIHFRSPYICLEFEEEKE